MSSHITIHPFFADHAVLQRDLPVAVEGRTLPGQTVKVGLGGCHMTARADASGRWEARFDPLPAGGPHNLSVSSSAGQLIRRDIMIGEVWVAAGASRMSLPVGAALPGLEGVKPGEMARLRLFPLPVPGGADASPDPAGRWLECSPETTTGFSALALHFGLTVAHGLDCPVGLVLAACPESAILSWLPGEAIRGRVALPARRGATAPSLWRPAAATATGGTPLPPGASELFDRLIAPLTRFPAAGVLWDQGEADVGRATAYREAQAGLIHGWRGAWGRPDLPFVLAQLGRPRAPLPEAADGAWAGLREAQALACALPGTAMAVTADLDPAPGEGSPDVRSAGDRLGRAALAVAYRRTVPHAGPTPAGHAVEGTAVRIRFAAAGAGLRWRSGEPGGFAVAGVERRFHEAEARIDGDTVVVAARGVAAPVAVRYGWAARPELSLENHAGLPAAPFRTDDWPLAAPGPA